MAGGWRRASRELSSITTNRANQPIQLFDEQWEAIGAIDDLIENLFMRRGFSGNSALAILTSRRLEPQILLAAADEVIE
jgi:hypothetical protein